MATLRKISGPMDWLKALPLLAVTAALTILALATLVGAQSGDGRAREHLFDYFQRIAPAEFDAGAHFQVVLIDRQSIEAVGPWPWPRTILAELVDGAKQANAKGVILTMPLDRPDPLSPETIGAFWLTGASDEALANELARLPSTDAVLANAFADIPGAIGVSAGAQPIRDTTLQRAEILDRSALQTDPPNTSLIALPGARLAFAVNSELVSAASPAVAGFTSDADGVMRRLPLLWTIDDTPTPSIALTAAQLAMGETNTLLQVDRSAMNAQGRIVRKLVLNDREISISRHAAMRLSLPKRTTVPVTSASQLLRENSNSQLTDKVILIGLDTELGNTVTTARGTFAPAALHALAAAQIMESNAPRRPSWAGYLEAFSVMAFGAIAIMLAQKLKFWQCLGIAAGLSIILICIALFIFANGRVLIDPLAPALALFVGALSIAGGREVGSALRDDSLRTSFHDTLPEGVIKRLREGGGEDLLLGAHREITVLACELRIADDDLETLEDRPDDVTKILTAASLGVRETIIDAGGAADQAEGGRIFAYFNAPADNADHIHAGCAAALRLIESMDKINTDLQSSNRANNAQVHLAIGIATGPCFVGPMGHGRNNRYSATGAAIDRACYLRSLSEYYGPAMVCDEPVYRNSHHQFAYLELDRIATRNAARPFQIYALIGNPFIKSSKGFRDLDNAHRAFLKAYRERDFDKARTLLTAIKTTPGGEIALFDIYEERLAAAMKDGVPDGWSGVATPGIG